MNILLAIILGIGIGWFFSTKIKKDNDRVFSICFYFLFLSTIILIVIFQQIY